MPLQVNFVWLKHDVWFEAWHLKVQHRKRRGRQQCKSTWWAVRCVMNS